MATINAAGIERSHILGENITENHASAEKARVLQACHSPRTVACFSPTQILSQLFCDMVPLGVSTLDSPFWCAFYVALLLCRVCLLYFSILVAKLFVWWCGFCTSTAVRSGVARFIFSSPDTAAIASSRYLSPERLFCKSANVSWAATVVYSLL
jgi:hypothetical protein